MPSIIKQFGFNSALKHSDDIELLRNIVSRFQRIFNGSGYGFWEWDLANGHIEWSGGFWLRIGYNPDEIADVDDSEKVLGFIHPEDREFAIDAMQRHFREGGTLDTTYRIRTKWGDYIWTQVRADSERDANGRVVMMSGVNFDITEIKKVEAALRESEARQLRIIQASSDGIWEWYSDRGNFHFSHRCWELLGYTDIDDRLTEGEDKLDLWRKHIHPEDRERFEQAIKRHLKRQGPFDIEYRLIGVDNEVRWVRARGQAIFDRTGRPLIMSGSNMDITALKRAEMRVISAKEQAEKANRAKSEFLSSMSHELRTPLNAILGYTQLFEYDTNLEPSQIDNVREIRKAGDHLLQLINDVLDLAKIESGNMPVSLEPIMVSRLVAECMALMQTQADTRGIRLNREFGELSTAYIVADPVRLKQALLNLLSNAIKYNRMGGIVTVALSHASADVMRIDVTDTGQGIPLSRQNEVFQPFNRLSAENTSIEGSGVGLVITKQLVEMMSGKLSFESFEGVGTTFSLEFPMTSPVCVSTHTAPMVAKLEPQPLHITRYCRLLYVEDNSANVRLMQQVIARYPQLNLDIAEEAFLGLYKARSSLPDLIILDINLPGMDGYEALSVLKNDPATRSIPVIALSANAMAYDVERGRREGFFEYLTKPVDIDRLIQVLNKALGERSIA